jgi:hydrogenase maturation protease
MSGHRTAVIGLGNPLLGDDGVGWKIAEQVKLQLSAKWEAEGEIDVECLSLGGLSLMEHLIGYQKAILIDAIQQPDREQGSVSMIPLEELLDSMAGHTSSAHDTTLGKALEVGRALGARLPEEIWVVGVNANCFFDFSDQLTHPIAAAIPAATGAALSLLGRFGYPIDVVGVLDANEGE